MISEQRHEMRLESTHPSGAEEWLCPECGRRFIAQWEPKFRRVVLEHGQEETIHVGHAMSLLEDVSIRSDDDNPTNDPKLQDVWKRWLDNLDLGPEEDTDLGE